MNLSEKALSKLTAFIYFPPKRAKTRVLVLSKSGFSGAIFHKTTSF
jgi:hypothetical protein